jgi:tetratricopeptide (TPR) repeat protein
MLVQRLIDVSLASSGRAARRIWLHEMLRQFARDVAPANERADTAHRYARSLGASLDRAAERAWSDGSYAPLLLLGVELDNVRQCLRFGFASGAPATALAVLRAPDYWTAIGRAPEGFVWFARARAQFGTERGDEDDALLLFGLSMCAAQSGRADAAIEPSRRAAERAAACGLMVIAARSHIVLGNALLFSGDARAAVVALEEAVTRFEGLDDSTGLPRALTFAAMALLECDRVAEAARAVARAHEVRAWFRKDADPSDLLLTDSVEIELARLRGDRGEVIERARRAVTRRAHGPTTSAHLRVMRQLVDGLIADGRRGEATDFGIREAAALRERGFETDAALLLARTEA